MSAVEATSESTSAVAAHATGILSTSGLLLLRRLIVTLGAAVATAVIARQLTTELFGIYSAALATFYIAQAFCDLGFGSVLARELAIRTDERPVLLRATVRPALAWSFTVGLAFAIFAVTTSDSIRMLCMVVLAVSVAITGASVSRQWFVVHYDVRKMAGVDLLTNLAQVAALILIALLGGGPVQLALAVASATVLNTVIVAVQARRKAGRVRTRWSDSKPLIVMSLPIGIPSILASAYFSIDLVLAGYLIAPTEVANYAAAVKMLTLVTVLPSLLVSIALPGFAAIGQLSDRRALGDLVARIFHWMVVVGLPLCAGLALFAPLAIHIFFGAKYGGAVEPLRVLMGAGVLSLLGSIFGTLLIAARRAAATLYQNIFALVANVTLNILLLPTYGIMAAAWLTLATEFVIVACSFWLLRRSLSWTPVLKVTRVPLLATAVLAGCSFLPIDNDIARAVVAGGACLLVITVLKGWPFDPALLARQVGRRLKSRSSR